MILTEQRPSSRTPVLRKSYVADAIRESILGGETTPGQKIVEGRWAVRLGVAQASVREAINTLVAEGYLTKQPGRSARVIDLTTVDLLQLYQVRAALEGLAAKLVVARRVDLSPLEACLEEFRRAAEIPDDIDGLNEANLQFHLTLCELSGNQRLVAQIRPVLCPVFAFARVRLHLHRRTDASWKLILIKETERLLSVLRTHDEFEVQQVFTQTIENFYYFIQNVWGPAPDEGRRRRASRSALRPPATARLKAS